VEISFKKRALVIFVNYKRHSYKHNNKQLPTRSENHNNWYTF